MICNQMLFIFLIQSHVQFKHLKQKKHFSMFTQQFPQVTSVQTQIMQPSEGKTVLQMNHKHLWQAVNA